MLSSSWYHTKCDEDEFSPEELQALASLDLESDGTNERRMLEHIQMEVTAFESLIGANDAPAMETRGKEEPGTGESKRKQKKTKERRAKNGDKLPNRKQSEKVFGLDELVKAVVQPEDRFGGADAIADALLNVKVAQLQEMNIESSSLLEMLSGVTYAYLQHNRLREIDGLQLALHLTVLVVHHNELTSLEGLADLPALTLLDASFNGIDSFNPETDLPCSTLRSLSLLGNPCCPRYTGDGDDAAYMTEYRKELLTHCDQLQYLDDVKITNTIRIELGIAVTDAPLLQEMTQADAEIERMEHEAQMATGLQANVTDEDFLAAPLDFNAQQAKDDAFIQPPSESQNAVHSSDDENVEPPAPALPSLSPAAPISGTVSLTGRLLGQYERHRKEHEKCLDEAVMHANVPILSASSVPLEYDPRWREVVAEDDDNNAAGCGEGGNSKSEHPTMLEQRLSDARGSQQRLRSELRQAQQHHSDVARMMVETQWNQVESRLRDLQVRSQQRRMETRERLSRPSAAYLAAIETLEKEAGGSLDKYRQETEMFASLMLSTNGDAAKSDAV